MMLVRIIKTTKSEYNNNVFIAGSAHENPSRRRKGLFGRSVTVMKAEMEADSCDAADAGAALGAGRNVEGELDTRGHVQK